MTVEFPSSLSVNCALPICCMETGGKKLRPFINMRKQKRFFLLLPFSLVPELQDQNLVRAQRGGEGRGGKKPLTVFFWLIYIYLPRGSRISEGRQPTWTFLPPRLPYLSLLKGKKRRQATIPSILAKPSPLPLPLLSLPRPNILLLLSSPSQPTQVSPHSHSLRGGGGKERGQGQGCSRRAEEARGASTNTKQASKRKEEEEGEGEKLASNTTSGKLTNSLPHSFPSSPSSPSFPFPLLSPPPPPTGLPSSALLCLSCCRNEGEKRRGGGREGKGREGDGRGKTSKRETAAGLYPPSISPIQPKAGLGPPPP